MNPRADPFAGFNQLVELRSIAGKIFVLLQDRNMTWRRYDTPVRPV